MSFSETKRWSVYGGIAILVLFLSACSGAAGGSRIWIDDPLDGERLPEDTVVVYSTSSSQSGVDEVTLYVDGEDVRSDDPAGSGELINHSQPWDPPGPGSYQLQVEMMTGDGETARSRTITLHIGEVTPTGTETFTPTPTETVTTTPAFTPTPTETPTPVPEVSINFNADSYEISEGECTTLRWKVENAGTVLLNGSGVSPENAREVCPSESTAYQLSATSATGEQSAQLTIEVQAPPQPPEPPQDVKIEDRVCNSSEYSVTVTWNDVAGNEDGYRVYRDGEVVTTLGSGTENYQDEPPGSGPYTYAVEAYNSSGASQQVTVEEAGCLY